MPVPVQPPTPVSSEFGLYSVATVRDYTEGHYDDGVQWEPTADGVAKTGPAGCEQNDELDATSQLTTVVAEPFTVWAGPHCDHLLGYDPDDFLTRARTVLALSEERGVEWALATAVPFEDPSLTPTLQSDAAVLADTPQSAKNVIGLLEQALGDRSGAKGVIHAPRRAIGHLQGQVDKSGARLLTKVGTPVAFGSGYTGQAPQTADNATLPTTGVVWVYATGPVLVTRTPTFEPGGSDPSLLVNRLTGELTVVTARVVTVSYEGPLFAVPLSLED